MNQLTDAEIDFLESHIPDLAVAASTQAYWQALASGSSVLKVEQGKLLRSFLMARRNS